MTITKTLKNKTNIKQKGAHLHLTFITSNETSMVPVQNECQSAILDKSMHTFSSQACQSEIQLCTFQSTTDHIYEGGPIRL